MRMEKVKEKENKNKLQILSYKLISFYLNRHKSFRDDPACSQQSRMNRK